MAQEEKSTKGAAIQKVEYVMEKYANQPLLRCLIQLAQVAVGGMGIPIGGFIDIFLTDRAAKLQQERMAALIEQTAQAMQKKAEVGNIDEAAVMSEEHLALCRSVLENAAKAYEGEKIGLFRNILVNSVTTDLSRTPYKEAFVNAVAELSITHIAILKHIYNHQFQFSVEQREKTEHRLSASQLALHFPHLTESQIQAFCTHLEQHGFLLPSPTYHHPRDAFVPAEYAEEFIKFIMLEDESDGEVHESSKESYGKEAETT